MKRIVLLIFIFVLSRFASAQDWVRVINGQIPTNALRAGNEADGTPLFIARAPHEGGVVVGKAWQGDPTAAFPYGGQEIRLGNYEVYVGQGTWATVSSGQSVPANAIAAGREADGTPLYVARAPMGGGTHVGKSRGTGAFIPYGGREEVVSAFAVLMLVSTGWTVYSTPFNPTQHGFKFVNTFKLQPFNFEVFKNVQFGGQCGGMAYAAFDYFNASKSIPNQNYRPAVGTTLQRYIFNRQQNSFWDNVDKWGELFVNPGGARTDEFFNWGLQRTNGGRVDELRQTVGAGRPVPLGLFKAGNGGTGPHHQVLAIGYEIGSRPEELKIKVYDPNYPNSIQTLVPDVAGKRYYYLESPTDSWQTYFVDKKYRAASPPVVRSQSTADDGLVRELMVDIATGGDDLRGQNDNVHATVNFRSGQSQTFTNINLSQRWIDNYSETVPLVLRQPVRKEDIMGIMLTTTFSGGIGGDNWNIDRLTAWYLQPNKIIYDRSGTPLVRLTGDNKTFTTRFWTNLLTVTLRTGGDDLRGGNEGFITLHYRDGGISTEYRLNQGRTLGNNSTNSILLDVPLDVTAERIAGVTIRHNGEGRSLGQGYDNWNLDGLQIQINGTSVLNLNGTPLIRFTGNLRSRRWDR